MNDHNSVNSEITCDIKKKIKRQFSDSHRSDKILIERNDLVLKEWIGRGNYGFVFKAVLKLNENEEKELAAKRLDKCEIFQFRITIV